MSELMRLRLPWGEEMPIEDMERFSMDIMRLTGEYYVDLSARTLVTFTADDFHLQDDYTVVVKACRVRFVEEWPEEETSPEFEKAWRNFEATQPAREKGM